jgi:hypothetical protein
MATNNWNKIRSKNSVDSLSSVFDFEHIAVGSQSVVLRPVLCHPSYISVLLHHCILKNSHGVNKILNFKRITNRND